jgi:antitoxin (DNA-binding transcriptional repressor) of toxin-antitoxin stability system
MSQARVWRFKPAADRTNTSVMRTGTQLNADELRRVLGFRLERAEHTGEPTQIWKHGELVAVLVAPEWFELANVMMRSAGHDHADDEFDPLPARTDSSATAD